MSEIDKVIFNLGESMRAFNSIKKKVTIEKVIFNDPATIVKWDDGTKTVVKCQPGDTYDAEKGLALCISKKFFDNKGNFNEVFKKWVPEVDERLSITQMREALDRHCGDTKGCIGCVLRDVSVKDGGCYSDMSDEIIRKHYNMVFGKNKEV